MPLSLRNCVGPVGNLFMYGGVGLAAGISALESVTGRPARWATAQYVGAALLGGTLELEVLATTGKGTVQARVIGRLDDAEVLTVNAALGGRAGAEVRQWVRPPVMPAPEDCHPCGWGLPQAPGNMFERLDIRAAPGEGPRDDGIVTPDGRARLWLRMPEALAVDAALLAVFADFAASALSTVTGGRVAGISLDNTLRVVALPATSWVLCESQVLGLANGFAHGDMRLFSQAGELLAIGSQTMAARPRSMI